MSFACYWLSCAMIGWWGHYKYHIMNFMGITELNTLWFEGAYIWPQIKVYQYCQSKLQENGYHILNIRWFAVGCIISSRISLWFAMSSVQIWPSAIELMWLAQSLTQWAAMTCQDRTQTIQSIEKSCPIYTCILPTSWPLLTGSCNLSWIRDRSISFKCDNKYKIANYWQNLTTLLTAINHTDRHKLEQVPTVTKM